MNQTETYILSALVNQIGEYIFTYLFKLKLQK